MKRCTKVDRKAPTSVFWDIDKCPVPSGFDAHQVSPCIKRFLRNSGYSGPLSITAVGKLTNVPRDVLRALSSTGIHLRHTESRHRSVFGLLFAWSVHVDLPANVMVISTKKRDYPGFGILSGYGLNLIYDFPHTTFKVPGPLEEEDKCSDTGGWKCTLCYDLTGLGAESLIKHFSSREHAQNLRDCFPYRGCSIHCLEAPPIDSATLVEATTPLDSTTLVEAPTLDSTMVKKQPKAKKKNSRKYKKQMEEQKGRVKRKKVEEQEEEGRGKRLKRKKIEEQEEEGRGKRLKIEEQKGRGKNQKMEEQKGKGKSQKMEDLETKNSGKYKAPTSVFWDIDKCPVPSGFDAHQVYPCIKRFLRNSGYSGPLSITAVGNLTHVPRDVLRALSSTGIHLTHTVSRHHNIFAQLYAWGAHVDLPANVMVISTEPMYCLRVDILSDGFGLNIIYGFPHSNFIVPGPLEEEDKCSNTVGWKCKVCYDLTGGVDAESLIGHFSSPEHKRNLWNCLPTVGCRKHCVDTRLDSTKVKKQPKAKKKNSGFYLKTKTFWKYKKNRKYKKLRT